MDLFWLPYWIDLVSKASVFVKVTGAVGICVGIFLGIICCIASFDCGDEDKKKLTRMVHKCINLVLFGSIFIFLGLFLPTKDTMHKMLAGKVIQEIGTLDTTRELAGETGDALKKSLKLVNKYLDNALENKEGSNE